MPELTKTFFEKILRDSERQDLQVQLHLRLDQMEMIWRINLRNSYATADWYSSQVFICWDNGSVCCSIFIGSYSGDQGESKRWSRVWPTFLLRGEKSFLLRLVGLIRFLKLWLQVHAVDVTAKLRGGDSTEVDFFTDSKYFSLWQNSLQVFQLIIKSQPVNEDTRKFLQPNRTFEKEVALGEKTKTLAFGV